MNSTLASLSRNLSAPFAPTDRGSFRSLPDPVGVPGTHLEGRCQSTAFL